MERGTTLRLLHTAPPETFLVFERGTNLLMGVVRHHTHVQSEPYWTVGDDPDGPAYRTRSDAVKELQHRFNVANA